MSIWFDHIKAVRKKCPNLSFKEALIEAKKTYNKISKTTKPIKNCKTSSKFKKVSRKSKKTRKLKSRTGMRRIASRRSVRGKKPRNIYGKLSKKFKCINYPKAKGC